MSFNSPAEPEILRLFRSMDDHTRHMALQLMLREFSYGECEADLFLSAACSELEPDREDLQDALYPFGRPNMEASRRHRMELERKVVAAERYAAGRAAMMVPLADPAFHGSVFGG